jgi:hypothetical protein
MGKYDHICELTGAGNYAWWSQQMTLALQGERLWDHCSSVVDASDLVELASTKPIPQNPSAITAAEKEAILDWLAKDAQAKALIDRKTSPVVANQLAATQTVREQWVILSERYEQKDLLSQYELRAHVHSEKLKDADDAPQYLGIFEDARRRFIQMGVTYSNDEAIFDLLQGLLEVVEWQIFKEFTMSRLSAPSTTVAVTTVSTPSVAPNPSGSTSVSTGPQASAISTISTTSTTSSSSSPLTFDNVAKLFTEKANAIIGKQKLAGPGSEEYASVALVQGASASKLNPATGLKMHRKTQRG